MLKLQPLCLPCHDGEAGPRIYMTIMQGEDRNHGRVCAGPADDWLNPLALTRQVRAKGSRVGVNNMTVTCRRLFRAGVAPQSCQNIVMVNKRLGYSNVPVASGIYAHSLLGSQRQEADAFAAAMEQDDERQMRAS